MLVNATQSEELRVAIVDGQHLFDLDIEVKNREQKKSNIYKGRITRIEPSLEAAFVNYGADRHGFLPLKEISRSYFKTGMHSGGGRPNIKELMSEGQEIVVQVEKEERGNKGAALTTFISLAGRFLVLMPNNPRAGGVSRRIEGEERNEIRDALSKVEVPNGMGLIVRTAGVGRSVEELEWDMGYLTHLWNAIEAASDEREAPFLIYQESNVIIRALRDLLRNDIGEILIDDELLFNKAKEFMQQVMPHNLHKLKQYTDTVPLFTRFQIESQIDSAYSRQVRLPSGGSIVIDNTEALVSIDINSSRATKGADIEETALNTNLEAADEVARQMRIRDIGGLIVIDFIDMLQTRNQREVENRLREALKMDRARVQVGRISRFGLLEMSRQRLSASLGESIQIVCPRCDGNGHIRGIESMALSILRIIEEDALKENTSKIIAQLPVKVATYLLNEKREMVHAIEVRHKIAIILIPNLHFETPNYEIVRVRDDDEAEDSSSYKIDLQQPEDEEAHLARNKTEKQTKTETPVVSSISPPTPPIAPKQKTSDGLFTRLWTYLFGETKEVTKKTNYSQRSQQRQGNYRGGTRRNARGRNSGSQQRNQNNRQNQNRTRDTQARNTGNAGNRQQQNRNNTNNRGRDNYSDRNTRTANARNDGNYRNNRNNQNDRTERPNQSPRYNQNSRTEQNNERPNQPLEQNENQENRYTQASRTEQSGQTNYNENAANTHHSQPDTIKTSNQNDNNEVTKQHLGDINGNELENSHANNDSQKPKPQNRSPRGERTSRNPRNNRRQNNNSRSRRSNYDTQKQSDSNSEINQSENATAPERSNVAPITNNNSRQTNDTSKDASKVESAPTSHHSKNNTSPESKMAESKPRKPQGFISAIDRQKQQDQTKKSGATKASPPPANNNSKAPMTEEKPAIKKAANDDTTMANQKPKVPGFRSAISKSDSES